MITHIDSVDVRGGKRRPQQISRMLHGAPGTRVTLTLQRGGAVLTIHVVRGHALDREFVGSYRRALAAKRSASMKRDDGFGVHTTSIVMHSTPPLSPFAAIAEAENASRKR
jgi:hypothetical protein